MQLKITKRYLCIDGARMRARTLLHIHVHTQLYVYDLESNKIMTVY